MSDLCTKYNNQNHENTRSKHEGESLRPWTWQWI